MWKRNILPLLFAAQLGTTVAPASEVLVKRSPDWGTLRLELAEDGQAFLRTYRGISTGEWSQTGDQLTAQFEHTHFETLRLSAKDDGTWSDATDTPWLPRASLLGDQSTWTPLTIHLDTGGQPALDEFSFRYRLTTENGDWDPHLVRPLQGTGSKIELLAPPECSLVIVLEHPDAIRGYGSGLECQRADGAETLTVKVSLGKTISGRVIDAETGAPIEDAEVAPMIFTPPGFSADTERAVKTGKDGAFTLRGVQTSIHADHPGYIPTDPWFDPGKLEASPVVIRLSKGKTVTGRVKGPDGQPLEGVLVETARVEGQRTGNDGAFELRGVPPPRDGPYVFSFSKEGYIDHDYRTASPERPIDLTLHPLPSFTGKVVFPENAEPGPFSVFCGPGPNPFSFETSWTPVDSKEGLFSVQPRDMPDEGRLFWIGVTSAGFAPWEGTLTVEEATAAPLVIHLKKGHSLSARLKLPSIPSTTHYKLEPLDRPAPDSPLSADYPAKKISSREGSIAPGESLQLAGLRNGHYLLQLLPEGATPLSQQVEILDADLDLGALRFAGTGTVFGVVNEPYESTKRWAFAEGRVYPGTLEDGRDEPHLTFKTNAQGEFRIDQVPVGKVTIAFRYNLSADMIDALTRTVIVREGETSEVRFEGDAGEWAQPVEIRFGESTEPPAFPDASEVGNVFNREPMLRLDVYSVSTTPREFWSSTMVEPGKDSVIPDLPQGEWELEIADWLGSTGFDEGLRASHRFTTAEGRPPVVVELGTGALIGTATTERDTLRHLQVIAFEISQKRNYYSRCGRDGDFIARYLPPDRYRVLVHDHEGGFADLGIHEVAKGATNCGDHELAEGGSVEIVGDFHGVPDSAFHATDADGLRVRMDRLEEDSPLIFGHLPPGRWTISLELPGPESRKVAVDLVAGESTTCRFPAE